MTQADPNAPQSGDPSVDASDGNQHEEAGQHVSMTDLGGFLIGAASVFITMTILMFQVFFIPSESMQPVLEKHDRVLVNKFAYGYSRFTLPFGLHTLLPEGRTPGAGRGRVLTWLPFANPLPARGDVVVFWKEQDQLHLIKRVIGLPGDTIRVENERLTINGELVERIQIGSYDYRRACANTRGYEIPNGIQRVDLFAEHLPNSPSHPVLEQRDGGTCATGSALDGRPHRLTGTPQPLEFVVPPGHFFAMGDNRDASQDSRAGLGYVPTEYLVGQAVTVLFTFKRCDGTPGLQCPFARVWRPL